MKRRVSSAGVRFGRKAERGIALVLVMMFLALLLTLGLASTMGSITEVSVNSNTRLSLEAFNTAEAGSVHAFELIRNMKGDFSYLLMGSDTALTLASLHDGDEFLQRAAKIYKGSPTNAFIETVPPGPMFDETKVVLPVQRGTRMLWQMTPRHFYEILVYDNAHDAKSYLTNAVREDTLDTANTPNLDFDFRVLVRSIGYVMREDTTLDTFNPLNATASAVVDTVVGLAPYPAIITQGDLRMENASDVTGTLGGVHANDDLTLALSAAGSIEQGATFSNGTTDAPPGGANATADDPRVAGFNGPADPLPLPDLNPYDYANQANIALVHGLTSLEEVSACINGIAKHPNGAQEINNRNDLVARIAAAGIGADDHFAITIAYTPFPTYTVTNLTGANNTNYTNGGLSVQFKNSGGSTGLEINGVPAGTGALGSGVTIFACMPGPDARTHFNGGTSGVITVLTNANMSMNGNSRLKPNLQILPPEQPPWNQADILCMAGMDLTMSGSSTGSDELEGVMYCHEQFNLTGNGTIAGQVVGYDSELVFAGVVGTATARYTSSPTSIHRTGTPVASSTVGGSFVVTHNFSAGYIGGFSQSAWRQLRDFDAVVDPR